MERIGCQPFYDFTVHGTHCYIASGVVHHNSGKTEAAAYKTARYVLETPPPRPRVPFWIIGETYELTCGVCWQEKLSRYIPLDQIAHKFFYKSDRDWPYSVLLKHPTNPGEIGWILEFKSFAQGRERMQAASIGGYWFNEEVPLGIVEEVQGRTRDYDSPGWADFTPIEIRSPEWVERYNDPPKGWRFFHLNSLRNVALAEGWAEDYLSTVPEDIRETRRVGFFTSFRGQVFKEWRRHIHVCDPFTIPKSWRRIRGIDFGFNNPFCCLWIARSPDGVYYVYDEHFESGQLNSHHAKKIHARDWDATSPVCGNTYSDHDAQQRAELSSLGVNTTPANKSVLTGIEKLRTLMMPNPKTGKPRLFVFSNCRNLIREMPAYKWPEAPGKDGKHTNPKELPVPYDDHAIDALRYAIYSEELSLVGSAMTGLRVTRERTRHGMLISQYQKSGRSNGNGHSNGNGNGRSGASGNGMIGRSNNGNGHGRHYGV